MVGTLMIEYGMILQENNVDIEQFMKLECEKQYELINNLKNLKQQKEFNKLASKSGDLNEFSK